MASINQKKSGSRSLQVVLADGSRKTIGLGKISKRAAETIRVQVELLLEANITGTAMSRQTAVWLSEIGEKLRRRLARLGLVDSKRAPSAATLGDFIEQHLQEKTDVKPRTIVRYRNQLRFIRDFVGDETMLRNITKGDGDRFLKYLKRKKKKNGEPLGTNYIHKIVKTSRQVFGAAINDRLMDTNPLESVKAPEQISDERDFEITIDMIEKLIARASPKYQLVLVLARYGGLRCPSELAGLPWDEIHWDRQRMTVHSPKTEHCGRSSRTVPIFPEVLPYLLEARERAADGQLMVFSDIDEESNLRTEVDRLLGRVGITEDVPRFFQNTRSSRQTELEEHFPTHVVCAWLGNSPETARKHYLKVRESHFEAASSAGLHKGLQQMHATCSEPSQADEAAHEKTLENDDSPAFPLCSKYTREDSNLQHPVPKTGALSS